MTVMQLAIPNVEENILLPVRVSHLQVLLFPYATLLKSSIAHHGQEHWV